MGELFGTTGYEVYVSEGDAHDICRCTSDVNTAIFRPCLGNYNWGGFRGLTCRAPKQDMLLTCGVGVDSTPEPTPPPVQPTPEPTTAAPSASPTPDPVTPSPVPDPTYAPTPVPVDTWEPVPYPTEEPVQDPTPAPTEKQVDPNKICKLLTEKKPCNSMVTWAGNCSWDKKKNKCTFKTCDDYTNKGWKCPKVAKKAGLTCYYNKFDDECTEIMPEYVCSDYDNKKACKKFGNYEGTCKYDKETKSCIDKK